MSLRKSIDAKCTECIYDPLSGLGNWRQQVAACTIKTCPLWAVRPVSKPDTRIRTCKTDSDAVRHPETACFGAGEGEGATGVAVHE